MNINKNVTNNYKKNIEQILSKNFNESKIQIGGEEVIVEIYESKFVKQKYNKGHKVEGIWVVVMVERTPERKVVFFTVENRKKPTLTNIICSKKDLSFILINSENTMNW